MQALLAVAFFAGDAGLAGAVCDIAAIVQQEATKAGIKKRNNRALREKHFIIG